MRYGFDGFEVDGAGYRLTAAGEPVALQPKALELLILLLEHQDRYLSKEEIFSRLWGEQVVSDGAMSHCIYLARQALGDDSRRQRYIQTLYGKGFRFSPDVEVVLDRERGGAAGEGKIEPTEATDVAFDGESPPRARRFSWRLVALGASGLLLVAVLVWWLPGSETSTAWHEVTPPATPVRGPAVVAILPWTSEESAGSQLLGAALSDSLSRSLARMGWTVLEPAWTEEVALGTRSLEDVRERTGVALYVSWRMSSPAAEDRTAVTVSLHDLDDERPDDEVGIDFALDPPVTAPALDELGAAVAGLAAEIIARRSSVPLAPEHSPLRARLVPAYPDPTAYRYYLLGQQWLSDLGCEPGGFEELLARSLDLAPEFSPAWEMAARYHAQLGGPCLFGRDHLVAAEAAARQAAALDPAAPRPALLAARVHLDLGEAATAWGEVRRVREILPHHAPAACLESRILVHRGRPEAARELQQPCFESPGAREGSVPEVSLYLGEPERFLDETRHFRGLRARYSRGQALLLAGRREEAERELAPLFRLAPGELWARLAQALLAVIDGEPDEAAEVAVALARTRAAVGLADGETSYRIAQALALAGRREASLRLLDLSVAQGFLCASCFEADPSLESLRGSPELAATITAARRRAEQP